MPKVSAHTTKAKSTTTPQTPTNLSMYPAVPTYSPCRKASDVMPSETRNTQESLYRTSVDQYQSALELTQKNRLPATQNQCHFATSQTMASAHIKDEVAMVPCIKYLSRGSRSSTIANSQMEGVESSASSLLMGLAETATAIANSHLGHNADDNSIDRQIPAASIELELKDFSSQTSSTASFVSPLHAPISAHNLAALPKQSNSDAERGATDIESSSHYMPNMLIDSFHHPDLPNWIAQRREVLQEQHLHLQHQFFQQYQCPTRTDVSKIQSKDNQQQKDDVRDHFITILECKECAPDDFKTVYIPPLGTKKTCINEDASLVTQPVDSKLSRHEDSCDSRSQIRARYSPMTVPEGAAPASPCLRQRRRRKPFPSTTHTSGKAALPLLAAVATATAEGIPSLANTEPPSSGSHQGQQKLAVDFQYTDQMKTQKSDQITDFRFGQKMNDLNDKKSHLQRKQHNDEGINSDLSDEKPSGSSRVSDEDVRSDNMSTSSRGDGGLSSSSSPGDAGGVYGSIRFHPYQEKQWNEMYQELVQFKEKYGHCIVSHAHKESPRLARWVKRQRYQYTLMLERKPATTMTPGRVEALNQIGFVWDPQNATWCEHLAELKAFKEKYHHSNVPVQYAANPQLAVWVKCQRRQFKLYQQGKPSVMSPERFRELESLGFQWELRKRKVRETKSSS